MKYVRRLLWFIASKLLIFSVIASVLVLAFYLAMNTANIYLLLSDGMQLRTSVILTRDDASELPNFFANSFLDNDEALKIGMSSQSPFANYRITSFESEVKLEWVWSWPWQDVAQANMIHTVPEIKGTIRPEKAALVQSGALGANPPVWNGGRYEMQLHRVNGQWKIAGMEQKQVILPKTTPVPTATP